MLDDHARRWRVAKFGDQLERGIGVVEVVVAERLALNLFRLADAGDGGTCMTVKGGMLVRVFAVAQDHWVFEHEWQRRRKARALIGEPEPTRDYRIIFGRRLKRLGREHPALVETGLAARNERIIGGIGDDRHRRMVFRRRTHHARAADVDILDDLGPRGTLHHGFEERVEIDDDEVDRADAVGVHCRDMCGIVADREQPAVHRRVQRLDAAVHHFGKAGQIGHIAHVETRVAQCLGGAAGRDEFDALVGKCPAEFDEAGLV